MSWLLTDDEFRAARRSVRGGDMTKPLYDFLARLVRSLAHSQTLAPALSPSGSWETTADADEALQEWYASRLPATLLAAFDAADDPRAFSRYLERAFRNWLTSRARSNGQPRLVARAREQLQARPEFRCFGEADRPADEAWGLTEWPSAELFSGDERALASAAYAVGELELLRYSAGSSLADPVIANDDLAALMVAMFERLESLLTLRQIAQALRARFGFAYGQAPSAIDEILPPDTGPTAFDNLALEETAREVLAELDDRQLAILRDRVEDRRKFDELASRHGVSRGTVQNELERARLAIRRHADSSQSEREILEKVLEVAFYASGETS
jgi:RNA polymerase sigma factor (sigma-70 family)